MIDKKQRIILRGIASKTKSTVIVGKEGFTENILKAIEEELFLHELVKINVLQNTEIIDKTKLCEIATLLNADVVTAIGRKIVLYKYSDKKNINHIL